ncbi:sugar O-acetyltransferase [Agrilactobacillus yilanensis]|uniref:Sugar O-acetyltransferase n=1 Tax=Agrilactobacillus yilanensis TaxID=2485997 RepID=A0ABW4J8J7_9LACO|nr:sugar O-acetyltransferase [Agrilactobacillus yilanensis]
MSPEKKKFLAGEDYQILDPELAADETRARRLCRMLNELDDGAVAEKTAVIKDLFGSVGKRPYIQPNFRCDFGYNIHVGDNFLCNYDGVILDSAPVTIGDNCLLAPHVQIYAAYHPFNPVDRGNMIGKAKPVTLGNDVWVGGGSAILPGVTLGNNVIVGTNSTVTKSFGDNVVIAGSPARVIRHLDPKND